MSKYELLIVFVGLHPKHSGTMISIALDLLSIINRFGPLTYISSKLAERFFL